MASVETIHIPPAFERDDHDYLYDEQDGWYERAHAASFQIRKNVQLGDALPLAMELPRGAWIAGGFLRSLFAAEPVANYDIFFANETALLSTIRRIQNAPEGTYLHGYEADISVRSFADSKHKAITFTHATKVPLKLVRVRYFSTPEDTIDRFDFTFSQFALDNDLNVIYSNRAIDDARLKRVSLSRVIFPVATGLRISRFLARGYTWINGNYDSYSRDEYQRNGSDYLARQVRLAQRAGLPVPTNTGDFGLFEP